MPQIINTNLASINAQRNLNKSQAANQTAMERLSSGLRINSAKDDAAGLAISTRFTSQVKGLNIAVRNAGDGIALAQTAEGALGSMNDNLQRIRELAVQSANATNSDVDREALQAEVEQLVAEISRTASEIDFNGRKLLDGSFKATFQIGANAGQTVDISIAELTAEKLGSSLKAGVSAQGTDKKLSNGDLIINGEAIRASVAGDDNLSYKDKESSAIAKVAAINASSDKTGVTAKVDENIVVGSKIETADAGSAAVAGTIKLNGVEISIQGTDNTNEIAKAGTRNSVVAAINSKSGQTGVTAEDGGENGGVILRAADGRNITIESSEVDLTKFGLADTDKTSADASTSYAGYTLTAANANTPINISGGNGTGNGDLANAGLKAGNYKAQVAATSSTKETIQAHSLPSYSAADFGNARLGEAADATNGHAAGAFDYDAINAALETIGVTTGTGIPVTASTTLANLNAALTAAFGTDKQTKSGYTLPALATGDFAVATAATANGKSLASELATVINEVARANAVLAAEEEYVAPTAYTAGTAATDDVDTGASGADQATALNTLAKELGLKDANGADFEFAGTGTAGSGALTTTASALNDAFDKAFAAIGSTLKGTSANATPGTTVATVAGAIADLNRLATAQAQWKVLESEANKTVEARALQDGDLLINGVTIGASSALDDTASYTGADSSDGAGSAIAIAAAINKSYDSTGVKAQVNATEFVGSGSATVTDASKGSTMTLTLNGVEISLADQGDYEKNKAAAISAINERAGETGVTAMDNGVSLTLTAADGRNITMFAQSAASAKQVGVDSAVAGDVGTLETKAENFGLKGLATANSNSVLGAKTHSTTIYSTVTLTSSKAFEVGYGTGGEKGLSDSGLVAGKFGGGEDGQALTEVDISTFEGAQKAIVAIDNAIGQVARQRADLGAIQNRMQSTVNNLQVTSENLNSANSRIRDADFAAETAELSRSQVLQQAGISILAQANAAGQNVLSLLG